MKIGDRLTFTPSAFEQGHTQRLQSIREDAQSEVTGEIIQIHEEHRWFRVRYETAKGPGFECFKF